MSSKSNVVIVPCPCLLCNGRLVTPHVRRKHMSNFSNAATGSVSSSVCGDIDKNINVSTSLNHMTDTPNDSSTDLE